MHPLKVRICAVSFPKNFPPFFSFRDSVATELLAGQPAATQEPFKGCDPNLCVMLSGHGAPLSVTRGFFQLFRQLLFSEVHSNRN